MLWRACDGAGFTVSGVFGDAVGDVVHRVIACHVLLLQEVGGVALALGKDGDEHIGPRYFGPSRGLHVNRGPLDYALEGGGGHGFGSVDVRDQIAQVLVDEFHQCVAQLACIDGTGFHDLYCKGCMDRLLKSSRE